MYIIMLNKVLNYLKGVCRPSQIFAIISIISVVSMMLQNMSGHHYDQLCVGTLKCQMTSLEKSVLFAGKIVYIAIWVIILDSLCKNKYGNLAWALVLLPFALAAIGLGHIMYNRM